MPVTSPKDGKAFYGSMIIFMCQPSLALAHSYLIKHNLGVAVYFGDVMLTEQLTFSKGDYPS